MSKHSSKPSWFLCLVRFVSLAFVLMIFATTTLGQAVPTQAPPMRVPAGSSLAQQPTTPVNFSPAGGLLQAINARDLGPVSTAKIAAVEQAAAKRYAGMRSAPVRVGIARQVGVSITSTPSVTSPTGEPLRTLAIRSPGAYGIRVHFTDFDVGDGSALVYAQGQSEWIVRGPFTRKGPRGDGEFWTASLPGEEVFVEVSGSSRPELEVAEIIHFDKPPGGFARVDPLPCNLDVMCSDSPPVNPIARDAVGGIGFRGDGDLEEGSFVCTGTLLNDLDDETIMPYFITAYHCGIRNENVSSVEVVYLYQKSECDGEIPDFFSLPRNVGGTVVTSSDNDSGNDMVFISLDGNVPDGVSLAGWNTEAPSEGLVGIHHPQASWKRVTFLSETGFCPGCVGCYDPTDYDYYDINDGAIESGSSGSGLFNRDGQLVDHLRGVCNLSGGSEDLDCSNRDDFVMAYGEFEETYDKIQRWLRVGGTIHVDGSYTGVVEWGTEIWPFKTVTSAYNNALNGMRMKIKTGAYAEALTLSRRLTIIAEDGPVTIGM